MSSYVTPQTLALTWRDGELVADNYETQQTVTLSRDTLLILEACGTPQDADAILTALRQIGFDVDAAELGDALDLMVKSGLLLAIGEPQEATGLVNGNASWVDWGAEAQYFHFATKDAPYIERFSEERGFVDSILSGVQPPLFKRYPDAAVLPLPRTLPSDKETFLSVLARRRTIREFTGEPVSVAALAQLCHLAFAPQEFIDAGPFGILPMKHYANAGARSELEVYVNVGAVKNLDQGLYHYNAVEHSLEYLRSVLTREDIYHLTYKQPMCSEAAVVFFITARVDRVGHKYRNPRALRAIYLDTGHLGQTFAMVATMLGLGPWQTAAFRDTEVERCVGIDGVAETVMYCLGVGVPVAEPVTEITLPASLAAASRTHLFEDFAVPSR